MLARFPRALLDEYRAHGMARFTVYVLAYGFALWLVDRVGGGAPALLWFLFWVSLAAAAVYYFWRLVGFIQLRLLWRLRWRLVVTYLLIAVVPIVLILFLIGLGAFIINGQFAAYLVTLKLRSRFNDLEELNRFVSREAQRLGAGNPEALLDRLTNFTLNDFKDHESGHPALEITLRVGSRARAFRLSGERLEKPVTVPLWLEGNEFAGFVKDGDRFALRALEREKTPWGELTVILSEPFTPGLLDSVGEGIGPVGVLLPNTAGGGESLQGAEPGPSSSLAENPPRGVRQVRSKSVPLPDATNWLDWVVNGNSTLDMLVWGGDTARHLEQPPVVYVSSRVVMLNRQLLATLGEYSWIYKWAFLAVALVFFVIEAFALVIGVRLTRSMTVTVDRLHGATEHIKAGDFSFRINLPARDQLSALGEAFDGMTASVERLLIESQEKSRLESELEIAREVQRQLFPPRAPEVKGLALHGVCNPARSVSGDYYDFLRLDENRVGLVLGDVSGKGISAALLMAAIQSALRAQLYDGHAGPGTPARVVERLNRQLFESTPAEKYITFFYAVYDDSTRKLTYTNAGHLPPALVRRGAIQRLEAGGTVVGLLSAARYEQAEIELQAGDVLLAFTDGLTEPENAFGEEWGEARLLEAARRALALAPEQLVEEVFRSVADWTGSPELQDDMTLLVAKSTG